MPAERKKPSCSIYEGIPIPKPITPDRIDSAVKYRPCSEDVFVVSYPKCGASWMQHIVYLIQHHGVPPTDVKRFFKSSSYIDLLGVDCVEKLHRPGSFKTHLPFHLVPYCPDARYVVVIRNPRDVVVSLHRHWTTSSHYEYDGTLDDSFNCFLRGEGDYGNYFAFYKGWLEHRSDRNVLLVVYEDLEKFPEREILRVATFLGERYKDSLLKGNKDVLKKIVKHSSTLQRKKDANKDFNDSGQAVRDSSPFKGWRLFYSAAEKRVRVPGKMNNSKNSTSGEWEDYLSAVHVQILNDSFRKETGAGELLNIWADAGSSNP